MERNGTDCLCCAPGTPRHWPRRSQDPKAQYHWPWAVGAGVVGMVGGGMGTGNERERVAYILPQTCADIYHTGVFQKYVFCSQSLWDKKADHFKILKFQIKKTFKGCFLSIMVNKYRTFIKNLRNTFHFTNS